MITSTRERWEASTGVLSLPPGPLGHAQTRHAHTHAEMRAHTQPGTFPPTDRCACTHPHSHIRMHLCTRCQVRSHQCAATCAYRHTRAHTDKHTFTNTVTCSHEHTHMFTCVHSPAHIYTHTQHLYRRTCTDSHKCNCTCTDTRAHTDIYTHTDTGEKKGGCSLHSREGRGIKG